MSNYLAIATVTATMHHLLNGIANDVPGVQVTNQPPDVVITGAQADSLNIFLYQVTPNLGYRNLDQPARSENGTLVRRPQLGLNLHYLITSLAAGHDDMTAHQILASAMRILHETPVLTRDMIRKTIQIVPVLAASNLADQIEMVKISDQGLSLEEMTKLWSSFFQTNYRISAAYQATTVLIDSDYESKPTLPVLTPQITTTTFRQPVIQQVQPQILEYSTTASLTLIGQNMQTDNVVVQVGEASSVPTPSNVSGTQIIVALPTGITAGIKTVQVVQSLGLKSPTGITLHKGFKSNILPFVLAPKIVTAQPIVVLHGNDLTLSFQPGVTPKQRVSFLIGDYDIPLPQRKPIDGPVTQLSVTVPNAIPTGTFLLRIRVDGADSLLQVDNNKASPKYGQFILPTVMVT